MTRTDTGSHNRLGLIQSLVPPHYVRNGYVYTFSFAILYIKETSTYLRLSSRLPQFKCCYTTPTFDVFLCCLLVTNLEDLHYTIWSLSVRLYLKGHRQNKHIQVMAYLDIDRLVPLRRQNYRTAKSYHKFRSRLNEICLIKTQHPKYIRLTKQTSLENVRLINYGFWPRLSQKEIVPFIGYVLYS